MDQGADMGRVTGGLGAPGARENLIYGVELGRHVTPPPQHPRLSPSTHPQGERDTCVDSPCENSQV
jgi:hypothetical protein